MNVTFFLKSAVQPLQKSYVSNFCLGPLLLNVFIITFLIYKVVIGPLWKSNTLAYQQTDFNTSINILHDEKSVKLLGIDIDSMLKCYVHIAIFAKKLPDN